MAFNIKDEKAVAELRQLAELEGRSMSAVASDAISESLNRRKRKGMAERVLKIAAEARADADPEWLAKTQDELINEIYDPETGLPW